MSLSKTLDRHRAHSSMKCHECGHLSTLLSKVLTEEQALKTFVDEQRQELAHLQSILDTVEENIYLHATGGKSAAAATLRPRLNDMDHTHFDLEPLRVELLELQSQLCASESRISRSAANRSDTAALHTRTNSHYNRLCERLVSEEESCRRLSEELHEATEKQESARLSAATAGAQTRALEAELAALHAYGIRLVQSEWDAAQRDH
eukprot:gnl/MRDRNA2_/MRDRNA2_80131_c0_seq3.p1 gnl/MRDRNA2_/MRDRNA2_80131_c0~~gnl/MRDRNA2_/MRDRNA2_80131_c0_seq3.p1  ORF type:complete len:206 (+),score=41.79 gnl/MRDRNA2_/MRDRNA2_80131_c0_seq3:141-758(+)